MLVAFFKLFSLEKKFPSSQILISRQNNVFTNSRVNTNFIEMLSSLCLSEEFLILVIPKVNVSEIGTFYLTYAVIGVFIQLNIFNRSFTDSISQSVPLMFNTNRNLHWIVSLISGLPGCNDETFRCLYCC